MMKREKLNRIISLLREQPNMNMGAGKIAGSVEAGDSPPVDLRKKKTKKWNPFFKDMARVLRRHGK